jgi:hypothetical protein
MIGGNTMPFFKRSEKTEERISSCQKRLAEISGEIEQLESKIEGKKTEVADLLGRIATDNKEDDKLNLQSARKVLGKFNSENLDLIEQKEFLLKEIISLEKELSRAKLRDLPDKMLKEVQEFNATLEEILSALEVMETLHKKMHQNSSRFRELSIERDKAMVSLHQVTGLDLPEGFGKLSRVPSPHRYDLMVPDKCNGTFFEFLQIYRQKLKHYEEFKRSNPDSEANIKRTRERDAMSSQTPGRLVAPRPWQL